MPDNQPSGQVFIAHGDSEILKRRAVEDIISRFLSEEDREYGLTRIHVADSDVEEITAAMSSGSLFATEQVIVLESLDAISKTQQQPLVPVLEGLGPATVVAITASPAPRGPSKTPNLSSPLVKYVKKAGKIFDCNTPPSYSYNDKLTPWVHEEAGRYGKSFAPGAVEELISLVGESCDRIAGEIEKLSLYLDERDTIETADIREVVCVTSDEDIFGLTDALGERNATRALEVLPDLLPEHASSGAGIPILAMITRHVRLLWQARLLADENISLLSKK
jgi:DNA polymerase-3 subunit delta